MSWFRGMHQPSKHCCMRCKNCFVLGFSGFEKGVDYPTVNLEQVQNGLLEMSSKLAGEEDGRQRWPLASVLLEPGKVIGLLKNSQK